jgi:hypothetical protein
LEDIKMAEYTANTAQTVNANNNVLLTSTPVKGSNSIIHREGSGLVTLRGITQQCRARFKVTFGGNIAVPTGGTAEAISLAIAINGEPIATTTMIETPAAVNQYSNVASSVYIDVPKCCCVQISVENTSTQAILVQNANLIVDRVA